MILELDKSIHELRTLLQNKEISATELTQSYLSHIEETEPHIDSFVTITRYRAMQDAEHADKLFAKGKNLPLTGIPYGLKDNLCTKDILTTCSSKALSSFVPSYDSTVAQLLKFQGAVLLGKLNMDELAMGSSTKTSYFKKTKNPYDLSRVPGGSSGGSTAAVAADFVAFSIGSDTGGSIRQPSSFCGVVGLKPTYGTISRYGMIGFNSSLDHIGPITKTVADCALVFDALTKCEQRDVSSSVSFNYESLEDSLTNNVKGLKIGFPKEYLEVSSDVEKSFFAAIDKFNYLGAQCKEFSLPHTPYSLPAYHIISTAEACLPLQNINGNEGDSSNHDLTGLLDVFKLNYGEGFGREVKRRLLIGAFTLKNNIEIYEKAKKVRTLIMQEFEKAFEEFDIIITPTCANTAFKLDTKITNPVEMYLNDMCTVSANLAGIPSISIPCGLDSLGLPIGLQLLAKKFDEKTLFKAAYTFEQNTDKIRPK